MLEFEFANTVTASTKNPAQCTGHNPGHGCTDGVAPGQDDSILNAPGNCYDDAPRKNANKGCF